MLCGQWGLRSPLFEGIGREVLVQEKVSILGENFFVSFRSESACLTD
jgi:hypothetical protein